MRMKKIAAACRRRGMLYLFDRVDKTGAMEQWAGNGVAIWPLRGLPYLKMDELCNILDLTDKQQGKMMLRAEKMLERIDLQDAAPEEVVASEYDYALILGDRVLKPVSVYGVTYLLDSEWLAPVGGGELELWLRRATDGWPYFVVKRGLLVVGSLLPEVELSSKIDQVSRTLGNYQEPGPEGEKET